MKILSTEYLLFIIFFASPTSSDQPFDPTRYKQWWNSLSIPTRLLELMKTYYIDADERSIQMNPMRFMYEESPHYELGYVIGEIIERYRKMVEQVKRPIEFKSDGVFATTKRTELIQKLYLETYHLTHILHEIPRKYMYIEEFRFMMDPSQQDEILKREDWIKQQRRIQKLKLRENQKRMKQMRELVLKNQYKHYTGMIKKPYNQWWPVNYGWEIDYYW